MIVGALGDVLFLTSSLYVLTIDNFVQSTKANYSTHNRHNNKGLPEFTGLAPDDVSFDVQLNRSLGVSPKAAYKVLRDYAKNGEALNLVLGTTIYGDFRWVISDCKCKPDHMSRGGDWNTMTVSLTLKEYPES